MNTTAKYLKQTKAVFSRALQLGLITQNPFDGYKFKIKEKPREFLNSEELERLENFTIDNDSIMKTKDIFLFSVYTGLRYIDIHNLKKEDVSKDREGSYWIEITQQKTNSFHRIPLLDKALEILEKYEEYSEVTGKVLPVISNQKVNVYLKVLADLSGIKKNLTFHMARHTNATVILLSNGVPIEAVSKYLGHTSIKTTQIYAKITNEHLKDTIKGLNNKL